MGRLPFSIGDLGTPDNHMPLGMATEIGRTEQRLATWRLHVRGAEVSGRWIIVDGVFLTIEHQPA
jgi:hypothetical protein